MWTFLHLALVCAADFQQNIVSTHLKQYRLDVELKNAETSLSHGHLTLISPSGVHLTEDLSSAIDRMLQGRLPRQLDELNIAHAETAVAKLESLTALEDSLLGPMVRVKVDLLRQHLEYARFHLLRRTPDDLQHRWEFLRDCQLVARWSQEMLTADRGVVAWRAQNQALPPLLVKWWAVQRGLIFFADLLLSEDEIRTDLNPEEKIMLGAAIERLAKVPLMPLVEAVKVMLQRRLFRLPDLSGNQGLFNRRMAQLQQIYLLQLGVLLHGRQSLIRDYLGKPLIMPVGQKTMRLVGIEKRSEGGDLPCLVYHIIPRIGNDASATFTVITNDEPALMAEIARTTTSVHLFNGASPSSQRIFVPGKFCEAIRLLPSLGIEPAEFANLFRTYQ